MKLNTVNVIEYVGDTIINLLSFSDDEEGNKEAEEVFKRCAKENGATNKNLKDYALEEGIYETHSCNGPCQVFLTHSCN